MDKTEIISKMKSGDWITLGLKLNCDSNTARMRFKRDNSEALLAMELIVTSRENVINETK